MTGTSLILASGEIIDKDDLRLHDFAAGLSASESVIGIALNSPGGSVSEAEKILNTIRNTKLTTVIGKASACASACFLLFAAGSHKVVFEGALVGVHSASSDASGTEGWDSFAATTAMAGDAAELNVPPGIIGKMVTTPPGRMAWLTPAELQSMGAAVIPAPDPAGYKPGVALTLGTKPPAQSAAPAPQAMTGGPGPTEPASQAFARGASDRRLYESWLASLPPSAKEGALFWAENRSRARRGERVGCGSQSVDWSVGCRTAARMLVEIDKRRLAEPDYRAGWNSY